MLRELSVSIAIASVGMHGAVVAAACRVELNVVSDVELRLSMFLAPVTSKQLFT